MISKKLAEIELLKREADRVKRRIVDEYDFQKQNDFVNDTSRFIVAQCSRRAGKSTGIAKRLFKAMEKFPGCTCIYLAMTRDSAKSILWPALLDLNDRFKLNCEFIESSLTVKHTNGSRIKLYGADVKNFIRRLRGMKSPEIAIDEGQDFGVHLQHLVDDILTPCMVDYGDDAHLTICGTPGPVPQGYFYDITQGRKYGYNFHSWTLFDNPFLPDPGKFLNDLKKRREWDDSNPTLKREWLNQWVLDVESLWIRYSSKANYTILPNPHPGEWSFILGIDIGFKDADALAVVGWNNAFQDTYLVEEIITKRQDITSLVEQIQQLNKKYSFTKMIIDEGGLGLKAAEEIRRRHSIPVVGAEKQRKQESVAFMNDALRLGKFKVKETSQFARDSYLIQIDWDKTTPDKIVIKKQPHSDIIDAVLYAFKQSPAYMQQVPIKLPKKNSKEYYDKVAEDLEAAAEAHFERIESKEWWED
jgi:hypothetical protein